MYRVPNEVGSTQNQDGCTVLDVERGRIFRLNLSGAMIFELLRQGGSKAEIVAAICDKFAVAQATAEQDVTEFFQSLERQHLLCSESPGSRS